MKKLFQSIVCAFLEAQIVDYLPSQVKGEVGSYLQIIKNDYTLEYRYMFLRLVNAILIELEDPNNYSYGFESISNTTQKVTLLGELRNAIDVSTVQESGRSSADSMRWNLYQVLGMLNLPYKNITVSKRPTVRGVEFKVSFYREYTR